MINQLIRGYQLTEVIGNGIYSRTYKAFQPGTQHEVAIKIISPEYANNADFIRRFEVDYQLISRLEHPHIVALDDYWREPDGAYIIMRCFPDNLNAKLANGPLSLGRTAQLVSQMTSALAAAHQNGIIHQNLTPSNILIDKDHNTYLADFGAFHNGTQGETSPYAAPEQGKGEPATTKNDIYSLGMVLFQALTGQIPTKGQNLPSLSDFDSTLPLQLDAIIQKATAQNPAKRYPDIMSMAEAFESAIVTKTQDGAVDQEKDVTAAEETASLALEEFIKGASGIRWRFEKEIKNPYKGLRPFEEADKDTFFGRDALTAQLLSRLAEDTPSARFLAVVGPSGSGKSSVIKAGVIAALRRGALPGSDQWFIVEMTPKSNPIKELSTAMLSIAAHHPHNIVEQLTHNENGLAEVVKAILPQKDELLLVIDQFEEMFTLVNDLIKVKHFLQLILNAINAPDSRIRVIITLRADFYDRPLMYSNFSSMVSKRTEIVVPLTSQELKRAIATPAEQVGIFLEEELIPTIVSEVKEQPGTLPMVQYALTELFDRREGDVITMAAYQAIGGILGSLTRRADEIYQGLTPDQQEATRQLFLRLVALGEGTEDTRRQAIQSELLSLAGNTMQNVIVIFGQSRLLTFDHDSITREPTVEIAHEAIIREWQRLRTWLDESRDDLRQQRLLSVAAHQWQIAQKDPSFLAVGSRLDQLEQWVHATNLSLNQEESDYIKVSITERDRQRQLEKERLAHKKTLEHRARRNLRLLALVSSFGAILAFGLAGFALHQQNKAEQAHQESEHNAAISHEHVLISNSQLALYRDEDTGLALALALEARKLGNLPDEEFRLLTETMYEPGTRRVYRGHEGHVRHINLTKDGKQVISAGSDAIIRHWDVETGVELPSFTGHTDVIYDITLNPHESMIASASKDGTVRIWDAETGETLRILQIEDTNVAFFSVAFHPDEQWLATGTLVGSIQLWDIATGELIHTYATDNPDTDTLEGHSNFVTGLTFSPDGNSLVSTSEDKHTLHWDIETGEIVRDYLIDQGQETAFTSDGTKLITATGDKNVRIWDFATGEQLLTLKGHTAAIFAVSLSPDERTMLTASQDGTIRLWELEKGTEIRKFVGHTNYVHDVEFLPNGTQFISSSYDSTLRLWDIETDETLRHLDGHEDTIYQIVFNSDSTQLLSASRDFTARLWDTETGEAIRVFGPDNPETEEIEGHHDRVMSAAFSPDGKFILSGDFSSYLILWDAESGEIIRIFPPDNPDTDELEGHRLTPDIPGADFLVLWSVTFSPDGKTAFSTAFDRTIIQWDLETGEIIRIFGPDDPETEEIEGHSNGVPGITFIDNGTRFLSHSWDNTIILWDVESGEILRQYRGHGNWVWNVALSPDEKTFLSASADKTMILWDVETGQAIRHFLGHEDAVLDVQFSLDGKWAISSGRDMKVTLWNVETGQWVRHYRGYTAWIRSVAHSPTENIFATGDNDGNILLWERQTIEDMVEWAHHNRYIHQLTCEERTLYRVQPYCDENLADD